MSNTKGLQYVEQVVSDTRNSNHKGMKLRRFGLLFDYTLDVPLWYSDHSHTPLQLANAITWWVYSLSLGKVAHRLSRFC